ncbi:kinesin-like nuclear fusion protein [Scheffersomyces spartinae]|uniref:Kinesin-like protein n=1 Tax=Scheffersomyces spartinae TaxID=45513 RepID=A0A9P7V7Z1_9ASCO|nr:kinesin-like nuclear fusion protein [Scheffersomyces spartinae]KAG7192877.1 kinesin-like nuclear fusion protein [Scheffersomyces spartinae]
MEYYITSPSKRRKRSSRRFSVVMAEQPVNNIYDSIRTEMEEQNRKLYQQQQEERELQTQINKLEFRNRLRHDELDKLQGEIRHWEGQIKVLEDKKSASIDEVKGYHQKELEQLRSTYDQENEQLMIETAQKIETTLDAIQKKEEEEKENLLVECNNLMDQLDKFDKETNQKMIKYKESTHKKIIGFKGEIDRRINDMQVQLDQLDQLFNDKQREKNQWVEQESKVETESKILKLKLTTLTNKLHAKTTYCSQLEHRVTLASERNNEFRTTIPNISMVDDLKAKTNQLYHRDIEMADNIRKQKHNQLQDLKGTIRVYCRIKPSSMSLQKQTQFEQKLMENGKQQLSILKKDNDDSYTHQRNNTNKHNFSFDKIFQPTESNDTIFEEISQLIQTAMDGYNVCIFAYGQTGSGKTYTMSLKNNGMIPLSILKIFDDVNQAKLGGWEYEITGEFVQIYNETIHDLIGPSNTNVNVKCEIKHDEINGTTMITNINKVKLTSKNEALKYLAEADKRRATASTKLNENSSRSHSIYIFRITGKRNDTNQTILGTLNLIDLAGSERLASSQATGSRLRETQAINKSLSSLGDVIYNLSLQQKGNSMVHSQHIPYRNSKLTYLLKNSLGGTSKTLMFANVSSELKDYNETLNSLRFASKVNATKLAQ